MSQKRIHRMLRIISLVQASRRWNARAFAEEFEVTERTIYRDLTALGEAGVPIHYDEEWGGYRLGQQFFMPPVHLTGEEALALAALCEHVAADEQIPFLRPARRALHKIESQLPASIREELVDHLATTEIHTAPAMPPDGYGDVYDRVQQAIRERRILRCRYESARAEPPKKTDGASGEAQRDHEAEFDFHPYTLFFSVRAWYAVGYHSARDDLRSLKLNRFTKIELTDRRYEMPQDFHLDGHLGNAWRMISDGPDVDVEIWIDAEFAQTIADTRWHRTQQIEWHADESCTFRCTVAGLSEIEWWVLSLGPHAVVKEPAELAERVRTLTAETAALYASSAQAPDNRPARARD